MSISEKDIKILWGRAGGRCSYCNIDLTIELESSDTIIIGEMAHLIAKKENGPRGSEEIDESERDSYNNLILLCANHHKMIDKAPRDFTVEQILKWKKEHEERIKRSNEGKAFRIKDEMFAIVRRILMENKNVWEQYGPLSLIARTNPMSQAKIVWDIKKVSTVIPNNTLIVSIFNINKSLLSDEEYYTYLKFKEHAFSFERNAYERLDNEVVITFPEEFELMLNGGE